jgi:hypothetical protein
MCIYYTKQSLILEKILCQVYQLKKLRLDNVKNKIMFSRQYSQETALKHGGFIRKY